MKFITPTIVGYSINVLNGHMLMILGFTLPPGVEYKVQTTTNFSTWNVIQTIPASPLTQQLNYSMDLTTGMAVFVTHA